MAEADLVYKVCTLLFVRQNGKILLGMKKRGFGMNKFNGFGGKVEKNETIEQGAIRELQEESGLTATSVQKRGYLEFQFRKNMKEVLAVHVFDVIKFHGEVQETEEMAPSWFDYADIPYKSMWADDEIWLPKFLAGKNLRGHFVFSDDSTIESVELSEVDSFDN